MADNKSSNEIPFRKGCSLFSQWTLPTPEKIIEDEKKSSWGFDGDVPVFPKNPPPQSACICSENSEPGFLETNKFCPVHGCNDYMPAVPIDVPISANLLSKNELDELKDLADDEYLSSLQESALRKLLGYPKFPPPFSTSRLCDDNGKK